MAVCLNPPSEQDQLFLIQQLEETLQEYNALEPELPTTPDIFKSCPLSDRQYGGAIISERRLKQILVTLFLASSLMLILYPDLNLIVLLQSIRSCPDGGWLSWMFGSLSTFCPDTTTVINNITNPTFLKDYSAELLYIGVNLIKPMKERMMMMKTVFDIYHTYMDTDTKKMKKESSASAAAIGLDAAKFKLLAAVEEYANACSSCTGSMLALDAPAASAASGPAPAPTAPGPASGPAPAPVGWFDKFSTFKLPRITGGQPYRQTRRRLRGRSRGRSRGRTLRRPRTRGHSKKTRKYNRKR